MVRDYNKFNFFALKYLDFWLGSDRQFFMEMANPEKKKRCQAAIDIAKEYKIAAVGANNSRSTLRQ